MSSEVTLFKITIKSGQRCPLPQVILIAQDTIIVEGTWLTLIEPYIDGLIKGLELAYAKPTLKSYTLVNKDLHNQAKEGKFDLPKIAKLIYKT